MSHLATAWNRFWHAPADLHTAAAFRIGFGLLTALSFGLQASYVTSWWGTGGLVPIQAGQAISPGPAGSLFWLLPASDAVVWVGWTLAIVHALLLAAGWKTRWQAIALFIWLVSFQNRNLAVVDGEDTLFRMFCVYLMFAPCAEVWALDARGRTPRTQRSGWAVRFIQLQTAFAFGVAGFEKWPGTDWQEGTALFYVLRLDDFGGRGWVPALIRDSFTASQVMSWGTLVLEFVLPLLVWWRPARRWVVLVAVLFHLALEYTMHLYLFEWLMILGWLSFLSWERDVEPLLRRITGAR